jgi:asparagine synthase
MNQIYGHQILPYDTAHPTFELDGASPVEIPLSSNAEFPQIQISAYPETTLRISYSPAHKAWVYIWGMPAHLEIAQAKIPDWCAKVVAGEDYEKFKELVGSFVVIVDEPSKHCLTFVSDILGVRPMFLGKQKGRVIYGSKVWPMYRAGLISGRIDYDAVSAWISYGFNCTNGSLFTDLQRMPPGSVVVIKNGEWKKISYAKFEATGSLLPTDQVVEELHEIVSSTLKVLLADVPQVTLALSGGYDSRYLLALTLSFSKTAIKCSTVSISNEEEYIACQVANSLGVPLETVPIRNSEWDLYDEPFHLTADGFPITKFITYCLANCPSKVPMLNGYMGDSLMRGSKDMFQRKYEEEWTGDLVEILQRKHSFISFIGMRPDIVQKIQMRSRLPIEEAVREGSEIGKIFGWADFYFRQRLYISNNFLQHLDFVEALLPFYSWRLLSYKMRHNSRMFRPEVYDQIFTKYFPVLSRIPRADTLPRKETPHSNVANCTKQWARNLLPVMCSRKRLALLDRNWCAPRTLAGLAGFRRYEGTIRNFQRLYLLEETVRAAGLDFDWEHI